MRCRRFFYKNRSNCTDDGKKENVNTKMLKALSFVTLNMTCTKLWNLIWEEFPIEMRKINET